MDPDANAGRVDRARSTSGPIGPEFDGRRAGAGAVRNQSMLTLPVGTGLPGRRVTVTKSCTVEPAATASTTVCAALWMSVVVVDGSCVTIVCEAAPTVGGFGRSSSSPVPAGSLQRSCQVSSRCRSRMWPGRLKSAALPCRRRTSSTLMREPNGRVHDVASDARIRGRAVAGAARAGRRRREARRNGPMTNLQRAEDVARAHVAARRVHDVVEPVDRQRVVRVVDVVPDRVRARVRLTDARRARTALRERDPVL